MRLETLKRGRPRVTSAQQGCSGADEAVRHVRSQGKCLRPASTLEAWSNPIRQRQLIATMNFWRCKLEAAGHGPHPAKSSRRVGPRCGPQLLANADPARDERAGGAA